MNSAPETVPAESRRRHPAQLVMAALLKGVFVRVDDDEYCYRDGAFCIKRTSIDVATGEEQDVLIDTHMTVAQFIIWCETIPGKALIQIMFGSVMSDIREGRP